MVSSAGGSGDGEVIEHPPGTAKSRKSLARPGSRTPCDRFNGAAINRSRKSRWPGGPGGTFDIASMGPRSIDRGNGTFVRQLADVDRASMGPRSIDRGNGFARYDDDAFARASMGPRSIDRGNWVPSVVLSKGWELQWGRGRSTAEIARIGERMERFNGAAVDRPRRFAAWASGDAIETSFNGAAVDRPRK